MSGEAEEGEEGNEGDGGGWALWRRSRLSLAEVFSAWKLFSRSRSQTHVAPLSDWMLRRRGEGGGGEAEEVEGGRGGGEPCESS